MSLDKPDKEGQDALTALMTETPAAPAPAAPSAPIRQPPLDQVGPAYMARRDQMEGKAALSSLLSEQAQPAEPEGATEKPNAEQPGALSRAWSGTKAVASDVGRGLLEAPKAAFVTGPRDAFQSMLNGATDLSEWLEKHSEGTPLEFMNARVGFDKSGFHYISPEEARGKPEPNPQLPSLKEPETVTGGIVKSASQFITSMATLGRAFGPMGTDLGGVMGHLATMGKSAAAMFTGFDKASGNLADLVEKVPALSNPVTRFLQSDPTDNEAEGRLKNAITGVGFGELQNGLLAGLKMLRGALTAKAQVAELPETPGPAGTPEQTTNSAAAFKFLGNADAAPEEPLAGIRTPEELTADKAARAAAATEGLAPEQVKAMGEPAPPGEVAGPSVPGATEAQAKEPEVYINFARIDTPDDVKRTLSQLADAQKDNIDIAKRGIQSFESTKLGADFTNAWQTLMERRTGEPLNAEQQLAGRQLLAQSAMKAEQLTQMTLESPTPENLFAWRKQMQTHAMIQAEVSGSQAEIARALGAMRIPVSGQDAIDRMAAITGQLDQMGGLKSNLDFLQATKTLMDAGKLTELGNVAEKTLYAKTRDALITGWTNGLLTNPLTHIKVNLSNIGTIALRLVETRFAETMDQATGIDGVPAGETAQTTAGLIGAIKDSFRYLGKLAGMDTGAPEQNPISDAVSAFKTGHYRVGEQTPEWAQAGQETSDALAIADSGWMGKATDLLSSVVTSPGRALAGEHEFYRSIGMRMELNRFAYRQAISELNAGQIAEDGLAGRVAELVEKPPPNITTQAVDGMTYQTFTDAPGKLAETIEKLRNDYPLVRVILPFYKIPSRIMSFTMERSPFAPLMAGWRADIAAGGARQSMALTKTGIGSAIMLAASDAVLNGQITGMGPSDKGQKLALQNTGWLPYSIKVGDRWVQYNRLETVGSSMAMAADLTETIRDYFTAVNADDPNVEKLTAAGVATLANNITSKTYFEGLARFFETIADPKANAENALKNLAGSAVPAGVGAVARLTDPYQRATYDMMDAIKSRIPGVSKDLPPLRNLWGEAVRHDSGLGTAYDAFVPFATRRPGNEPIDQEILKQGFHFSLPATRTSFGQGAVVDLKNNPEIYSRYVQLAGNELKSPAWGMGTKDLLNAIVSGNHPLSAIYNMKSDGPDGGKYVMLRDLMEQSRNGAKRQLMDEFPSLRGKIEDAQQRQAELKMPVIQ